MRLSLSSTAQCWLQLRLLAHAADGAEYVWGITLQDE